MNPKLKSALTITIVLCVIVPILVYTYSYAGNLETKTWTERGQRGDALGGHLNVVLSFLTVVLLVASIWYERRRHREQMAVVERSARAERYDALVADFWRIQEKELCLAPYVRTKAELEGWTRRKSSPFYNEKYACTYANACSFGFRWTYKTDESEVGAPTSFVVEAHSYVWVFWEYDEEQIARATTEGAAFFRLLVAQVLLTNVGQFIDHAIDHIANELATERDWDQVRGTVWMIQRVCNEGYEEIFSRYMTRSAVDFCRGMELAGWLRPGMTNIAIETDNFPALTWDKENRKIIFDQSTAWSGKRLRPATKVIKDFNKPKGPATDPPVISG